MGYDGIVVDGEPIVIQINSLLVYPEFLQLPLFGHRCTCASGCHKSASPGGSGDGRTGC